MDNVIDIQTRIDRLRQGQQMERHREKIRALQKVLHCSSCHLKCAMCGHPLSGPPETRGGETTPPGYAFCDGCKGEFEDFMSISSGGKGAEVFWHTTAWMEMWSAWLDFQQAIQRFKRSPEYTLLLSEIEA